MVRLAAPIVYFGAVVVSCCYASVAPGFLVVLLAAGATLLNGTGYGLVWSAQIAHHIARLHANGVYDVLAAAPPGAFGIVMDSMTTAMHRNNNFRRRTRLHTTLIVLILLCLIVTTLFTAMSGGPFRLGDTLSFYILLTVGATVIYSDFVQSIVLSGLAGVAGGALVRRPYDAGILGAVTLVALQGVVYGGRLLAVVVLVPILYELLPLTDTTLPIVGVLVGGLAILGLREAAVFTLWRWVLRRVEGGPIDRELQ